MRLWTLAAITSFAVLGWLSVLLLVMAALLMVFSPWPWPLLFMPCVACTYMPNASWRRRGVATARGGGSPTLETKRSESGKGAAQRRAAQAQRGSLGIPLAGARGGAPLSGFCRCSWFLGNQGRRCG